MSIPSVQWYKHYQHYRYTFTLIFLKCSGCCLCHRSKCLSRGITPKGVVSIAVTRVKMQSKGQGSSWGSVKRCSVPYLQHSLIGGQAFAHVDSQRVKGKNSPWSRPFKNLDRGHSSGHSTQAPFTRTKPV